MQINSCIFFGLESIGFYKTGMARYGVTLFFVLSGYLITYLLLIEKEEYMKIDLPKFYLRRILRIWPIYYLVIIITILIFFIYPELIHFPETGVFQTFILYSILLSNVGYGFGMGITTITPLWSVGVEEQFYAFWPFLLNKSKTILYSLLGVILIYLIVKVSFRLFENDRFYNLISLCSFDCMAIGGIGAYLVYAKSNYLRFLYNPIIQIISWSVFVISILYRPIHLFSVIDIELNAIFYILIIINVSSNKKTLINLENRILDFIGSISYGIYVYHMIVIVTISHISTKIFEFKLGNSPASYIIVFSSVIIGTIVVAFLSYKYFETFFLRLKVKYSRIESISAANTPPISHKYL